MGQSQSQEIERFVGNNVNTTSIANVISNYSTRTNATVLNAQDLCVNIVATGDIDFGSGFSAVQRIDSMINVESLVDRVDKDSITNDLQRAISTSLHDSLSRMSDTGIWNIPSNQRIKDDIISNIDTYVSQVVNTNTIDEVLLSSSNIQNGCYTFQATNISGPITITQEIQAKTMATNMVTQVIERALHNRDIQTVDTTATASIQGPPPKPASPLLFYILGAVAIVMAIVLAYIIPMGIKAKIAIGAIGVIVGIGMIIIGITISKAPVRVGKRVRIK